MQLEIPYGNQTFSIAVDGSKVSLVIAKRKNVELAASWEVVVAAALAQPIGVSPIPQQNLRGKKVAIITDDWGRPTPAYRVIPLILEALSQTGVADADITFVTASGMHDPMSREDLARKLGQDVVATYRCISHDGGDWDMLKFISTNAEIGGSRHARFSGA